MNIRQTKNGFAIDSAFVNLGQIVPVVNGALLENASIQLSDSKLHYTAPLLAGGTFSVEIIAENTGRCWLRYELTNLPADFVLDSFGVCFTALGNLRSFLRNGYFSWDGTYYVEPELAPARLTTGYAMTQLIPRSGSNSIVVGFDRHDRYQQTFTLDSTTTPFRLTVETLWDQKHHEGTAQSERLVIFEAYRDDHEAALHEWASLVAQAMSARLDTRQIFGWCSWYNLYAAISEENILEHLNAAREVATREQLPMWVFQIDDGFTPEMGDWLDVKPQFPRGMKPLLDDIRAAGFKPGLWIAPFMVGNRSRLYREHPDWVVQDRQTGQPLAHMRFYGEFRWHKRSEEYYILDTTHPDAFEYLRLVFRTWRHEWGCEYFKTDFMQFGSEYGPDRAKWHQSGMTRIEIWRHVAEMIREEIGDATWLGCGCPLWAAVGLVDAVRIGRDVGVEWRGNDQSAQSLLRDQMTRNFAHRLFQTDPDCILLRERFHNLSDVEVRSLAFYAGMSGGLVMTSDTLTDVSAERLGWLKMFMGDKAECRFPLLGRSPLAYQPDADPRREWRSVDPVIVQVRSALDSDTPTAVFILNSGDVAVQRSYPLKMLGLPDSLYAFEWMTNSASAEPIEAISVNLAPHDSALIFLSHSVIKNPSAKVWLEAVGKGK